MHSQMSWAAMYCRLDPGDVVSTEPIQLGEHAVKPGDRIKQIGSKKRAMFQMQDGFSLEYVGQVDEHLLFTSRPTGCDGKPWYYGFMYVDSTTLLIGEGRGYADIKTDLVVFDHQEQQ